MKSMWPPLAAILITVRNEVAKVMFLQLSVIHSVHSGTHPTGMHTCYDLFVQGWGGGGGHGPLGSPPDPLLSKVYLHLTLNPFYPSKSTLTVLNAYLS